ncbi:pre T-cell antigen receptor alpha [Apteryx rowi]|uniref:pre T-cell antigen receptor alpha n=1 Tax=Apteryx rowi TaxID=308060 RepID=UPI000E1D1D7B|nr:pre T-cell antigen receptor alpha [Apteryx rowi]
MGVAGLLLLATLLQLLPSLGAAGPFPTLAPPLTMVVNGQRRRLVACVVSDLPPGSRDAVWISSGDGSTLGAFAYGVSHRTDGTASTVSVLPADSDALACHVGPDRTVPAHSSEPLHITGMALAPAAGPWAGGGERACSLCPAGDTEAELCPGAPAAPRACAAAALLMAIRVLLLKVLLFDALLTSVLLATA